MANPHNSLSCHNLIKLLVITELTKQGKTWDEFIYQFSNPKKSLGLWIVTPSKPHSPKTPNPPTQAISLLEQKTKKLVDTPAASSRKKTKNPIDISPMPSTSIDPTPKKLQEAIQQYFPVVPTNKRGANQFKGGSFRKISQNWRGKPYVKYPSTSDPIQLSSNLKIPHKILREVYA